MHNVPMRYIRTYGRLVFFGVLAVVILVGLTGVGIRLSVQPFTYTSLSTVPHAQVAVVLGASVYLGQPSPILKARADAAIALYKAGKVDKILVTGDNGALSHDEVTPVRKYLLDAGIPAGDIFLDHAGFDTYSSMYRARDVFEVKSMIITTQDFHLPRALFIARHLGITAYGYVASGGGQWNDYVREIPASIKAIIDLAIRRVPKYLGATIPITGDGSTTWY
jgi:SanA protein